MQAAILGMLVACICHDLDHRGTNNTFERKRNNPLAKLYSTSTLERHHLNHCLLILNIKGNGILDNLSKVRQSLCYNNTRNLGPLFSFINESETPTS